MNVSELEAGLDIPCLLDRLSIDTYTLRQASKMEWRCACFLHGGDGDSACSIRSYNGRWYVTCYSHNCFNGTLIDALIQRGHSLSDVMGAYAECQGESTHNTCHTRIRHTNGECQRLPDNAMSRYERSIHHSFIELGYDRDMLLDVFDVRYDADPNSPLYGYVVYPIRDKTGAIWSIQGRRTSVCGPDAPKYRFMPGFNAKHLLYGAYECRELIRKSRYIVVAESPKSTYRGYQLGVPCLSLMGIKWTEQQAQKIAAYGRRVILAADNDAPGINGMRELEMWLKRYVDVRTVVMPDANADVSDYRTQSEWDLILQIRR